ncbi:MAG: DUF4169 family protein [Pseudomonadota bacterium]
MADKPINLRLRRKQKARDDKRRQGDAAAAQSGISGSQRSEAEKITRMDGRRLDGKRLDRDPADDA